MELSLVGCACNAKDQEVNTRGTFLWASISPTLQSLH